MPIRHRIIPVALGIVAGIVATAGTIAVAVAGFALSFDAITSVARASHIRADIAWMYPVTVDGSMAVATVVAVVLHRMRQPVWYPWLVVIWGVAVSIGCNGLHAYQGGSGTLPPAWAVVVSAVPAANLALSVHLLVTLVEAVARRASVVPAVAPDGDTGSDSVTPDVTPVAPPAVADASDTEATATATDAATTARQPAPPDSATATRQPDAVPDDTEATERATPKRQKPRQRARQQTTRERVAAAVARRPDATPADVAERLRLSVRTVQRYWPHPEQERAPVLTIAR